MENFSFLNLDGRVEEGEMEYFTMGGELENGNF